MQDLNDVLRIKKQNESIIACVTNVFADNPFSIHGHPMNTSFDFYLKT
jgi:hypothetical protein